MKKDDFRQQLPSSSGENKPELCQTTAIQWIPTKLRWTVSKGNCWGNVSQNKDKPYSLE